jgi:hypothetical protein
MAGELKTCFKCGETKDRGEFYRHGQMGDGLLGKCKDCTKRDVRQHRMDNADALREYDRERSKRPERRAERTRRAYADRAKHPDKTSARYAVSNALRDGRLKKRPCAFCGFDERVEAHHHDYSKPLDVTWLCSPCHRRFHALERMATYRQDAA